MHLLSFQSSFGRFLNEEKLILRFSVGMMGYINSAGSTTVQKASVLEDPNSLLFGETDTEFERAISLV